MRWFIILILLIPKASFSQDEQVDRLRDAWLREDDNEALAIVESMENSLVNHDRLAVILYYKGCIQFTHKLYIESKLTFEKILSFSSDLLINYDPKLNRYITASQLLHNSSSYMHDIEFELGNFKSALFYQRQADYQYSASMKSLFAHGFGIEKLYSSTRYAACYSALGLQDSVLIVLVPIILEETGYSYEALLELRKHFSDSALFDLFSQSILTIENDSAKIQLIYKGLVIDLNSFNLDETSAYAAYHSKLAWAKSFVQ